MKYRVAWIIDVEADTPREAAEQCHAIQQDVFSTATVFNVRAYDEAIGVDIDLEVQDECAG